jgi:polysaccharide deacetylase family protein (PEP-CTERM system associated)
VVPNALSFDVEEYFQVHGFQKHIPRDTWKDYESRLASSVENVLNRLASANVKATFFILSCNVQKDPAIVKEIASLGHEIGSHGWDHRLIYTQTRDEFFRDVERSKKTLEDLCGQRVAGYRAPSYSITARSLWALEELARAGFLYDSSIYPIRRRRYGIPGARRVPHQISAGGRSLVEFPLPTVRLMGVNAPVASGAYMRLFPFRFNCYGIDRLNKIGVPAIVNIHTWELDPRQPKVKAGLFRSFVHYYNLEAVQGMFDMMLKRFRFVPAYDCLKDLGYFA